MCGVLTDSSQRRPDPLDLVLRTPIANVRHLERRVDPAYRSFAIMMLPGTSVAVFGTALAVGTHQMRWSPAGYAAAALIIGGGLSIDAFGTYALATGGRRRSVPLPVAAR